MKIEYRNTFLDILRFNISHQFRNVATQCLYILMALFVIYSELTVKSDAGTHPSIVAAILVGFVFYCVFWILQFLFNIFYLYSRRNQSVLTSHLIEIQDDALYEETHYNKSYFYWHGIVRVTKITGYIAIYVTPLLAHIVPDRAFADRTQKEAFYNALVAKVVKGKASSIKN